MRTIISLLFACVSVAVYSQDFEGKMKERVLGNEFSSTANITEIDSFPAGHQMGIIIDVKERPTIIKKFHISIAKKEMETFKFKLNFYDIKDGKPDKRLNKEDIILSTSLTKGIIGFDISKYNIRTKNNFFVAIEWLEDSGDGKLFLSTGFLGCPIYFYSAGHGWYSEQSKISVGMSVTVMQGKKIKM